MRAIFLFAARLFVLSMGVLVSFKAAAFIVPTGNVQIFGGDPGNDGPLPPVDPLILTPDDEIFIDDLSSLIIDNGSQVDTGAIGSVVDGDATLLIDGAGTTVNLIGDLNRIDLRGSGNITISNGATVNGADPCTGCNFFLGNFSGGDAVMDVTTGGTFSTIEAFVIGAARADGGSPLTNSTGTININTGGSVNSQRVFLSAGASFDPSGTLFTSAFANIDGIGSTWFADEFSVGSGVNSDATVNVTNGGALDVLNFLSVADFAGSTGTININGSSLSAGDEVFIGNVGNGFLNVTNRQQLLFRRCRYGPGPRTEHLRRGRGRHGHRRLRRELFSGFCR